ncbi:MAG: FGGY-family carbohydrate kinase [Candidatus Hermodarchaeota archaeon]
MEKKYILTHDLGTSGNKAVLFDLGLNVISQTKIEYPLYYPKPGWAEQNPNDYWDAVKKGTNIIINESSVDKNEVIALAFDCQMNCTIPIDKNGIYLMNSISWLDTRAAPLTHNYSKGVIKISGYGLKKILMFLKITGGAPGFNGKDPISHILWMKEKQPEIYGKTYKFLSVKDYIIFKCTQNAVTSRDLGNTSWMMDSNPGKFEWSEKILQKFGIEKEKLPEIKITTEIAGELTDDASKELNLQSGIPIFVSSGDLTSGALGSGAIEDNKLIVCLGTADWVGAHTSKRVKDLAHYTGCISSSQGNYLCISKQETGASCLDWLVNQMFISEVERYKENPSELFTQLNSIVKDSKVGSKNLIFTPWIFGERSPINDPDVRGGFYNLSLEHTRNEILRSIYEGVAYNIKWALTYVEKLVGRSDELRCVGGGAKSDIWCQILADILERKILQTESPDLAAARGSAIISMVGLGLLKNFTDATPLIKVQKTFTPNTANKKVYNKLFNEYRYIYKRNKNMFKKLNL